MAWAPPAQSMNRDVYTDSWLPYNALAEIYSKREDGQDLFAIICEPNGNELDYIHSHGRMEELVISAPGFIQTLL